MSRELFEADSAQLKAYFAQDNKMWKNKSNQELPQHIESMQECYRKSTNCVRGFRR
jgi:hypothetical protein